MIRRFFHIALLGSTLLLAGSATAKDRNVLDIKTEITDSNIIYPESFENDTRKMMEGWYMKNYTATDDRYRTQRDVEVSDAVLRERLANLPTVIDMPYNSIVRNYIERYTSRGREQVAALLGLSNYYMPIFEQALEEAGLPNELKYLPVIESALNPNAVSKHGAAGLWQFMLNPAKGLDMEVNSLVDERRDPYVSSKKAAVFLKDLYSTYKDWSLAIAAYNCGPGTVNKALRRAGGDPSSHDFWSIYYFLPSETRGYVPMFIAANYVMNYYPEHNISPVLPTKPLVTDTLMISDRVHFDQISHVLDIPVEELRVLNPQFRADVIPGSSSKSYTLILPSVQCQAYLMSESDILAYQSEKYSRRVSAEPGEQPGAALAARIEQESEAEDMSPIESPTEYTQPQRQTRPAASKGATVTVQHKVSPGETLAKLAETYGVTVDEIKGWNNLRRSSIRTGQMLRITTTSELAAAGGGKVVAENNTPRKETDWTSPASSRKETAKGGKNEQSSKTKKQKEAAPKSHSVKSGENLSVIARKYGVTVDELKRANGLKSDALRPGDQLKVPSKGKSGKSTTTSSGKKSSKKGSSKSKKKRR